VAKGKKQEHYVLASRICMFALTIAALLASTKLSSIIGAYKYLGLLWSGVGTVMIARWYWWRVNPWSEIAALGGSMLIGNALAIFMPSTETQDLYTVRLAITIASVSIIWVIVTLLTSRKPRESDRTFYKKMRIAGGGWKRVADETGVKPIEGELRDATICWVSCTVLIFGLLVGVGKLLMHQWSHALICVVLASIGGYVLKRTMSRISFLSA
jgi:SSS family solute:Na+ symporter